MRLLVGCVVLRRRLQVRFAAVAVATAVSVAFLSGTTLISGNSFLVLGGAIVFAFLWLDVVHRVAQDRAMARSREVEKVLRTEQAPCDGPLIGERLSAPNRLRDQLSAVANVRVYGPYLVLAAALFIVSRVAHSP